MHQYLTGTTGMLGGFTRNHKPYSYSSGITQLQPHLSFPFKVYWAGEVYFESISSQNTEIMRTLVIIVSFSSCEEKGQKSNNIHMKTMIK